MFRSISKMFPTRPVLGMTLLLLLTGKALLISNAVSVAQTQDYRVKEHADAMEGWWLKQTDTVNSNQRTCTYERVPDSCGFGWWWGSNDCWARPNSHVSAGVRTVVASDTCDKEVDQHQVNQGYLQGQGPSNQPHTFSVSR